MIPNLKTELIVARFTFVSHLHPNHPLITLTRKKHSPSGSMTVVRDWFERIVSAEKAILPPNGVLRFAEYRILSGNTELFFADESHFDKIVLVIGEEFSYWTFYQSVPIQRRIEGRGILPITYCPCCFQNQYMNVMKTVKKSIRQPQFV